MHRFGWLVIGLGALLLLGKGGLLFLPLFFLPFLLWPLMGMLLFRGLAHGRGHGPWGPRRYSWRGRQGYYYDPAGRHGRHGCHGRQRREGEEQAGEERRGYTGETQRL